MIAQRLGGDQYWQLGVDGLSVGLSPNDGFTIYMQNKTEATPLISGGSGGELALF